MAVPIVEKIALAIEARLKTVTVANAYEITVADVLRPTQLGIDEISPRNLLVVMVQVDPRLDDRKRHPLDATPEGPELIHWIQPWAIALFVQTSESADPKEPVDTLLNQFRASIEKALVVDPGWGATPTTPLAYETRLVGAEYFQMTAGGFVGASVIVEVSYRTIESDPYTQPTI